MEKTWRWFGKKDKITLDMLRLIGVEGIVTALHDVPNGEIWTEEAINDLKTYIESYGLRWSVVESLPVCEAIKYAGPEREQLIDNYKVRLANLGKCGVKTVCYNFMPVIDWIRTDLQHPWADGTSSLYFDRVRFAYFDLRILGIFERILRQVQDDGRTAVMRLVGLLHFEFGRPGAAPAHGLGTLLPGFRNDLHLIGHHERRVEP